MECRSYTLREMWFFPQETGVVCIVYVEWTENMVTSKKLLFAKKYEFYPKKNKLHPKRNVVKYPNELHCCLRETDFAFSQIFHSLRVLLLNNRIRGIFCNNFKYLIISSNPSLIKFPIITLVCVFELFYPTEDWLISFLDVEFKTNVRFSQSAVTFE